MSKFCFISLILCFWAFNSFAQTLLIDEDFETAHGKTPPSGWSVQILNGVYAVDSFHFFDTLYHFPPPIAGKYAMFDSYNGGVRGGTNGNGNGEETVLISPSVSTSGMSNLQLEFDYYLTSLSSSNQAGVYADVSTNGSAWTQLWSATSTTVNTTRVQVNLNSYINQSTFRIRLRWKNIDTAIRGYCAFDNVKLFQKNDKDIAVAAILEPWDFVCALDSLPLRILIKNIGTDSAFNVPVVVNVSGADSAAFNKNIASVSPGDTSSVFMGYVSSGEVMHFTAFTNYNPDQERGNDTLKVIVNTAPIPATPVVTEGERCGSGRVNLSATANSGDETYWFSLASGGVEFANDSNILSPQISQTMNYYVENSSLISKSISSYQGHFRYNGSPTGGSFFDIKTFNEILIDSISQLCAYAANNVVVSVYYKQGTYVGFETNASVWTLLKQQSVSTEGWGKYLSLDVPDLRLLPGQTYGFYVTVAGAASPTFKQGQINYSNSDVQISGSGVNELSFGGVLTGYAWNGKVHYKKICSSNRVMVTAKVHPRPVGASLLKGLVYEGYYKSGTENDPDITTESATISYYLQVPLGYDWTTYGLTWEVSSIQIKTVNDVLVPGGDSLLIPDFDSNNGKIEYTPRLGWADSTLVVELVVHSFEHGCDSILKRYVFVAPTPKLNIVATDSACEGEVLSLSNNSSILSGTLSYKWYFGNGDSSDHINPIYKYFDFGLFPLKVVAISDRGILKDTTIMIRVNELPLTRFTVRNACEGDSLEFTNQTTISTGGAISYEWDFSDGQFSTQADPKHIYSSWGDYQVKLKASVNGCSSSISRNAYQFSRPEADFSYLGDCHGEPVRFQDESIIASAENTGAIWNFGDGSNPGTGKNPFHLFDQAGTKEVRLVAISQFGCTDTIVGQFVLKESPVVKFTHDKACNEGPVNFTNLSTEPSGSLVDYRWNFGDGGISMNKNPSYEYLGIGDYTIVLKADANNGCSHEIARNITVEDQPVADFSIEGDCAGTATHFINKTTNVSGGINYSWNFGDGNASSDVSPFHTYENNNTTTYNIKLSASTPVNGCFSQRSRSIQIGAKPDCSFSFERSETDEQRFTFTPANKNYPSYLWSFGGDGQSTEISPTHRFSSAKAKYRIDLHITTEEGCQCIDTTVYINTDPNASIATLIDKKNIHVFPNPGSGVFNISILSPELIIKGITLHDAYGKTLALTDVDYIHREFKINLDYLTQGLYYLNFRFENNTYSVKMITISR